MVYQDQSTMKVCTDSCIFGAWIAQKLECGSLDASRILDIGTGTGLLSLMIAQKSIALIDAIDILPGAIKLANTNFGQSPWSSQLHAFQQDIKHFKTTTKYDLIICNPPFYRNHLRSPLKSKNIAKHECNFSLKDLLFSVSACLNENGHFAVLLPYDRISECVKLLTGTNYFINSSLLVRQTSSHNFFRVVLVISQNGAGNITQHLTIKDKENFSNDFVQLLIDYYLHLG